MTEHSLNARTTEAQEQRRILWFALVLNATMFFIEFGAGLVAQSSGLLADALDMMSDASAYGVALIAIGRSDAFKRASASVSGLALLLLGGGVMVDVIRRALFGSEPEGVLILAVGVLALVVNIVVFRWLRRIRNDGLHLTAAWIFTRADVIANLALILSGLVVLLSGYRIVDLLVGAGIGIYVIREAMEILAEVRKSHSKSA